MTMDEIAEVIDEPIQILIDELKSQGKTLEQTREIVEGLGDPMDQLDMAEWLADHRVASRQEMLKEKQRLQSFHSI